MYAPLGPVNPAGNRAREMGSSAPSEGVFGAFGLNEDISVFTNPGQQQLTRIPFLSAFA